MARVLPRGSVVLVDVTDVATESEAGATHPVLVAVVQSNQFRFGSTLLVVPFTTNLARARDPFGVLVPRTDSNGLGADSVAMCWQMMAVDRARIAGPHMGRLSAAHLDLIAKNIAVLIDFLPWVRRSGAPGRP